jgi:hypothetical protein
MTNDYTVLNDWAGSGESSHQEIAEQLLPKLKEEMPEERYEVEFMTDLQRAVIDAITRDLSANLAGEDWIGMGFDNPKDFLDAEAVSAAIGEQAEWYFEDDQTGKSWDILQVILEYAEEYDLVKRSE